MTRKIKFSVHRNPLKDKEGRDTYQVRHECYYTAHSDDLKKHLKLHQTLKTELVDMTLQILKEEIVEFLTENKRLHLDGFGTFYLKVGLRSTVDDDGNRIKPQFNNPNDITGNDVCIDTIGFIPDKEFLSMLNDYGYSFENLTGRGTVGHSVPHDKEKLTVKLASYLEKHGAITVRDVVLNFGLTRYAATKLLKEFSEGPDAILTVELVGGTHIYRANKNA